MQDLPRKGFTETDFQSGTLGNHLENNYCDKFRSSAKKLSSIFQWLALSSDILEVQNLKITLTVGNWSLQVTPSISLKFDYLKGCSVFNTSTFMVLTPKSLYSNFIFSIWRKAQVEADVFWEKGISRNLGTSPDSSGICIFSIEFGESCFLHNSVEGKLRSLFNKKTLMYLKPMQRWCCSQETHIPLLENEILLVSKRRQWQLAASWERDSFDLPGSHSSQWQEFLFGIKPCSFLGW